MNSFGRPLCIACVLMAAMVIGRLAAQPAAQDALTNRYDNARVGAALNEPLDLAGAERPPPPKHENTLEQRCLAGAIGAEDVIAPRMKL